MIVHTGSWQPGVLVLVLLVAVAAVFARARGREREVNGEWLLNKRSFPWPLGSSIIDGLCACSAATCVQQSNVSLLYLIGNIFDFVKHCSLYNNVNARVHGVKM